MTCRSGCATPRRDATGSRFGSSPRWATRRGRARLWRLEAFTSKSQADWEAFLGALDGAPSRVVCDNDDGLTNAVRARFPDAELYLCDWHLRHALND